MGLATDIILRLADVEISQPFPSTVLCLGMSQGRRGNEAYNYLCGYIKLVALRHWAAKKV